jgi:hypothetical protein
VTLTEIFARITPQNLKKEAPSRFTGCFFERNGELELGTADKPLASNKPESR